MEDPIKMDDLGVPLFSETLISIIRTRRHMFKKKYHEIHTSSMKILPCSFDMLVYQTVDWNDPTVPKSEVVPVDHETNPIRSSNLKHLRSHPDSHWHPAKSP